MPMRRYRMGLPAVVVVGSYEDELEVNRIVERRKKACCREPNKRGLTLMFVMVIG